MNTAFELFSDQYDDLCVCEFLNVTIFQISVLPEFFNHVSLFMYFSFIQIIQHPGTE
jgi:hypothetical protein